MSRHLHKHAPTWCADVSSTGAPACECTPSSSLWCRNQLDVGDGCHDVTTAPLRPCGYRPARHSSQPARRSTVATRGTRRSTISRHRGSTWASTVSRVISFSSTRSMLPKRTSGSGMPRSRATSSYSMGTCAVPRWLPSDSAASAAAEASLRDRSQLGHLVVAERKGGLEVERDRPVGIDLDPGHLGAHPRWKAGQHGQRLRPLGGELDPRSGALDQAVELDQVGAVLGDGVEQPSRGVDEEPSAVRFRNLGERLDVRPQRRAACPARSGPTGPNAPTAALRGASRRRPGPRWRAIDRVRHRRRRRHRRGW